MGEVNGCTVGALVGLMGKYFGGGCRTRIETFC